MNKYITIIILSIFISCSLKSQNAEETITNLKSAFAKNDDKLFLENFPKNYNQFVSYFGWNDSLDKPYPLYKESTKYIDKFFNIITKDKNQESLDLLVDISLGGKYQADGVSYLKMNIEKLFIKNPNLSCKLLKNRKSQEIDSFWHFYLDSPQPLTSVPDYLKNLKTNCKEVYFSLEKEIKTIQKENLVSEITTKNKTNKLNLIIDFIPKGYFVLDSLPGYIDNDKFLDKIIILANNQEFKNNESRLFLLLLNNSNKGYSLKMKSPNVIPCIKCAGGTGGEDAYSDLVFQNNILSFSQFKIIDSKIYEINYNFLNIESDFSLNKVTITNSNLTVNSQFKVKITPISKTSLKDFDYHNYETYLRYSVKINDLDGFTNLRKEKNSTSTILEKIKTGEIVKVLDNSTDWWFVESKSGNKGYVFKTKIKLE
nr:SH3 domain-containing protein [uncultured Flavobacterium sp.]